jgi:prolyl-tRNA synthetase
LDKEFKKIKIENVQLPLFIKNSEFLKEKSHLDGFLPETFVVGRSNSDSTDEQLLIRPTSEVLFSNLFKENIQSYVDLPLKYNQWCSVYRVEKNTRPFLRGSEFFWHELHAIFVSEKETKKFVSTIDKIYNKFLKNVLNIHFLYGEKTKGERFAGAIKTYTREV